MLLTLLLLRRSVALCWFCVGVVCLLPVVFLVVVVLRVVLRVVLVLRVVCVDRGVVLGGAEVLPDLFVAERHGNGLLWRTRRLRLSRATRRMVQILLSSLEVQLLLSFALTLEHALVVVRTRGHGLNGRVVGGPVRGLHGVDLDVVLARDRVDADDVPPVAGRQRLDKAHKGERVGRQDWLLGRRVLASKVLGCEHGQVVVDADVRVEVAQRAVRLFAAGVAAGVLALDRIGWTAVPLALEREKPQSLVVQGKL